MLIWTGHHKAQVKTQQRRRLVASMNRQTETKKSILHSCHLHTRTHTSTHAHAYVRAPRTHTRMHTSQAATSRFPRHVENRDSSLQRTASGTLPAQKSLLETAPEARTQTIRTTTTATLTLTAAQTNVLSTNMNLVCAWMQTIHHSLLLPLAHFQPTRVCALGHLVLLRHQRDALGARRWR